MTNKTLEEHVKYFCPNPECKKPRNGEDLQSFFSGSKHYVSWECGKCGETSWWKTKQMSSGVEHITNL